MRTQAAKCLISLSFAAALITCLVVVSGVSMTAVGQAISRVSLLSAAGIFACTAVFIALSAAKWRMVMQPLAGDERTVGWGACLFYTSLGAALSIVLTIHISLAVARALGARVHLGRSPALGAGASIYEQGFDLLALPLFAVPAVYAVAFGAGAWTWVSLCIFSVTAGGVFIYAAAGHAGPILARSTRLLSGISGRFAAAADFFEQDQTAPILTRRFMLTMFLISVLRYTVLMLRAWLVLRATQIAIGGADFLIAFPLVQLSQIIAVTPGGLGITEWTWSGALTWQGYSADHAAEFAIVNRVANMASILGCFLLVFLSGLATWLWRSPVAARANREF